MNNSLKPFIGIAVLTLAAHASAQITFYEGEDFHGRAFSTNKEVGNFEHAGFNNRASSAVVDNGRWEVCTDARFEGRCVVLTHGSYDSLRGMGIDNRISSVRPVDERHAYNNNEVREVPAPLEEPNYQYRRRPDERLHEVPVTSVRAVMGTPEQRCWVEHRPTGQTQIAGHDVNVPGAVIGGVLGGILGHQIGSGTGNTLATIGGLAGGAAVGSNVGNRVAGTHDVRHCDNNANNHGKPEYWDVTYDYRGETHHVQMSTPPGKTILVNRDGEPRL